MTTNEKKILKLAKQLCADNGCNWYSIHDAQKGQYIIEAHKILFQNH